MERQSFGVIAGSMRISVRDVRYERLKSHKLSFLLLIELLLYQRLFSTLVVVEQSGIGHGRVFHGSQFTPVLQQWKSVIADLDIKLEMSLAGVEGQKQASAFDLKLAASLSWLT
jgi:hypothetical protein